MINLEISLDTIDDFTRAYIECALWSSNDESTPEGGHPLDENYSPEDLAPEALARMVCDCSEFQIRNEELLARAKYRPRAGDEPNDMELAGYDFWLTRNGHGAGFWDGDLDEDVGAALTKASEEAGECNLYVGDDGQIHVM